MKNAQADIITFIIILFLFALSTYVAIIVFNEIDGPLKAIGPDVVDTMLDRQSLTFQVLDYSYILLTAGLMISLFISGFFLNTHPIFMVISIILAMVDMVIAAVVANAFDKLVVEFAVAAAEIPVTIEISRNWPLIALLAVVVFGLGLYTKRRVGSETVF